jgi:hypothetical protein
MRTSLASLGTLSPNWKKFIVIEDSSKGLSYPLNFKHVHQKVRGLFGRNKLRLHDSS